jgi:hypothetical protein
MQMEQANPLRIAGIYSGVGGSLVGQVPYGYVAWCCFECYLTSNEPHLTYTCCSFLDAYVYVHIIKCLDIWIV